MSAEADRFYMGLALELARRGVGRTSPNPAVGCVVVREGRVIGRGFHPAAGQPHAEIFALQEAGEAARGADLFVTLEPCAHRGRTPPCTDRLIEAGLRRVVAAMEDPNPAVAGRGLARLREAGVAVAVGVEETQARRLNEAFALSIRERRAFVHLKLAATLDGRIATRSGDSRWVSCEESRRRVHGLRDACGAVVVGVGTAVADDPLLTVRVADRPERHILRGILDPDLRAPPSLRLFARPGSDHTVVACSSGAAPAAARALGETGARILRLPTAGGLLDLATLLSTVYEWGVMEVLVEGGAQTARSFLDAGLVDRFHLFLAPRLLGGTDAVPVLGGGSPERMEEAVALHEMEIERVGTDLYVTGVPHRR